MPTRLTASRLVLPFAAAVHRPWFSEVIATLQLGVLLGLLWLGLFGGRELLFGALAIVAAVTMSRMVVPLQRMSFSATGFGRFATHFIIQSLAGGIDVARRALHPRCPLTPGTWVYEMRLPPGQGRILFIGCIGLLPGTVGRAVQGDQLWVHSLSGDPQKQLVALEQRVAGLYGITLPGEGT